MHSAVTAKISGAKEKAHLNGKSRKNKDNKNCQLTILWFSSNVLLPAIVNFVPEKI